MVLEGNNALIGIDCGASKVLIQSAKINPNRTIISKGRYSKEYVYSSHPDWDPSYQPTPIDIQIKENNNTEDTSSGSDLLNNLKKKIQ